ncbi:MAG: O-antigen ligase family protein, partial [Limnohabitans sp.]|nr:O-antigen ligase family protein [Limnohabitans sp.]
MRFNPETLTRGERLQNGLVLVFLSWILVVPGGPLLLALLLTTLGLLGFAHLPQSWVSLWSWPQLRSVAWGFAVFVAAGVFVGVWYGYGPGYYEAYIPFLMAPFMLHGVLTARLQAGVLWLGSASAAWLAGVLASYQSLVLDVGRAKGAMNHPIIFGDLSVVLASIALFGVLYSQQAKSSPYHRVYLLLGALMGVWASLLSGTKGGWFSIVMVMFVFAWRLTADKALIWRALGLLCIVALIIKGVLLAPEALVWERLEGVWGNAKRWFDTGEVTDWSVSIRLELWSYAWELFSQKPLLGWSGGEALAKLAEHLKPFNVPVGIAPVFENDLLHFAAVAGSVGVLSVLGLYVGVFFGFWQFKKQVQEA